MRKLYFTDREFFIEGRIDKLFLGLKLEKAKQILNIDKEFILDDYTTIWKYEDSLELHFSTLSKEGQELVNIYSDNLSPFLERSFTQMDFQPFFFEKGLPSIGDFLRYCEKENLSFQLAQDFEGQMLVLFLVKSQVFLYFEYDSPLFSILYQDLKENSSLLLSAFSKTSLCSFEDMYSNIFFSNVLKEENEILNLEMAIEVLLKNPLPYVAEKNLSHLLTFLKAFEALKRKELSTTEKDLLSYFQNLCQKKILEKKKEDWDEVLREMLSYYI